MLSEADHSLLIEIVEELDKFTRKPTYDTELSPSEFSGLMVMIDILKPLLPNLRAGAMG